MSSWTLTHMKIDFSKYKNLNKRNRYLALNFTPDLLEKIESYSKKEKIKKSQFTRELIKVGLAEYEKN